MYLAVPADYKWLLLDMKASEMTSLAQYISSIMRNRDDGMK